MRGEPTGVCDLALRFRELSPRASDRLHAAVGQVLLPPPENPNGERRASERRWFGRRVIARGRGHPRVLLGRDLSAGGMQVENATGLAAGEQLQLALHSQSGDVPLVLRAEVLRTGAGGKAALVFPALSESQQEALAKMLGELGEGLAVVSEVLDPSEP